MLQRFFLHPSHDVRALHNLRLDLLRAVQNVGEEQHHRLATGLVDLLAVEQVEEEFPDFNGDLWRGKKNIPMNSRNRFLMVCERMYPWLINIYWYKTNIPTSLYIPRG